VNVFTVDILTPNKVVVKDLPAESVLVPTTSGLTNILKDHTHLISKLCVGEVSIFGGADDPDRHFSVNKGIFKVLGNKITILSEVSEEAFEIDTNRAQLSLENAQSALSNEETYDEEVFEKYLEKIELSKLRIQLSKYENDNK